MGFFQNIIAGINRVKTAISQAYQFLTSCIRGNNDLPDDDLLNDRRMHNNNRLNNDLFDDDDEEFPPLSPALLIIIVFKLPARRPGDCKPIMKPYSKEDDRNDPSMSSLCITKVISDENELERPMAAACA